MPVATDDGTTVPRHDASRRAVEAGDLPALGACFTSDATFHSPTVWPLRATADTMGRAATRPGPKDQP